jgi:hypothetical protein
MAQSSSRTGGQVHPELIAQNDSVAVPAGGNTVVLELSTLGLERIAAEFTNAGFALDAFIIQAKFHPGGDYRTIYSTAGAFTSPAGLLVAASGDLTVLADAATGWFILDVTGIYAIRVQASANGGQTALSAKAMGS